MPFGQALLVARVALSIVLSISDKMKTRAADRVMDAAKIGGFSCLTIGLAIGLGVFISASYRINISRDWEARRCDPGVVVTAGLFKPANDPRTAAQFATDNLQHCQKNYVQDAISAAAAGAKELAEAEASVVGVVEEMTSVLTDVFVDVWRFCYEAYSSFMESMKGAAKLFQNFFIKMHNIMDRIQGAAISIVFGLIAVVTAYVSIIQVVLIVAIVIIGIIIALQIILFFIFLPISGLIILVSSLVSVVVVAVATAISAALVSELFTSGEGTCFAPGTQVAVAAAAATNTKSIEEIRVGDILADGGTVTAVHRFWSSDPLYDLRGIQVTGDHLVEHPSGSFPSLIPVSEHILAQRLQPTWIRRLLGGQELWCLTTTTRRIPVLTGARSLMQFADWEEIPEGDMKALRDWHAAVWKKLNGTGEASEAVHIPTKEMMESEGGLAPDCQVQVVSWTGQRSWVRVADVPVGARIAMGVDKTTRVIGRVELDGDEVAASVNLPDEHGQSQLVSVGSWIWQGMCSGFWGSAASAGGVAATETPDRWIHLYTESGEFMIRGGWRIRDASEVGLAALKPLVEAIVLAGLAPAQ